MPATAAPRIDVVFRDSRRSTFASCSLPALTTSGTMPCAAGKKNAVLTPRTAWIAISSQSCAWPLTITIAKEHLGGAASWGFILATLSAGLILGGLVALRWRPRRALLVGCLCVTLQVPPLLLLAIPAPTAAIAAAAFLEGVGIELFGIYWDTSLQQHVPREALSRVSSYDALGSWVLMPIGFAVVGPIAAIAGTRATLLGASALVWLAVLAMAATGDIRRLAAAPSAAPASETEVTAPQPG